MAHPQVAAPLAEPDARRRRAHQSSAQPALSRPRQPWSLPPPAIAIPRTRSIIISTLTYDLYHILGDIQARARARAVIKDKLCSECGNFRPADQNIRIIMYDILVYWLALPLGGSLYHEKRRGRKHEDSDTGRPFDPFPQQR